MASGEVQYYASSILINNVEYSAFLTNTRLIFNDDTKLRDFWLSDICKIIYSDNPEQSEPSFTLYIKTDSGVQNMRWTFPYAPMFKKSEFNAWLNAFRELLPPSNIFSEAQISQEQHPSGTKSCTPIVVSEKKNISNNSNDDISSQETKTSKNLIKIIFFPWVILVLVGFLLSLIPIFVKPIYVNTGAQAFLSYGVDLATGEGRYLGVTFGIVALVLALVTYIIIYRWDIDLIFQFFTIWAAFIASVVAMNYFYYQAEWGIIGMSSVVTMIVIPCVLMGVWRLFSNDRNVNGSSGDKESSNKEEKVMPPKLFKLHLNGEFGDIYEECNGTSNTVRLDPNDRFGIKGYSGTNGVYYTQSSDISLRGSDGSEYYKNRLDEWELSNEIRFRD